MVKVDDSTIGNNPPPACTMPISDAQLQVIGYPVS
jgi:hypothetical protein